MKVPISNSMNSINLHIKIALGIILILNIFCSSQPNKDFPNKNEEIKVIEKENFENKSKPLDKKK